ncbi:MAG: hypothetical protein WCP79_13785 [Bacillota bacterium]
MLKIGIVDACVRGGSFRAACEAVEGLSIQAVCDLNTAKIAEAAAELGAREQYLDYRNTNAVSCRA